MKNWYQPIILQLNTHENTIMSPIDTLFNAIFLPNHQLLIHFISIEESKLTQLAPSYFANIANEADMMGIRCVHLWEDVYHNHPQLVISRLFAMIGQRIRIHARSTEVVRINKESCETFLEQHHLQGYAKAYYKYALVRGDKLVAVASFSKSRVMQDGIVPYRSYELIRFASLQGYTVTGGLGKLIKRFSEDVHPAHIMTYADRDWGKGAGYQKLGFETDSIGNPMLFYLDPISMKRYQGKHKPLYPDSLLPIYNSGNIKYILDNRSYTS